MRNAVIVIICAVVLLGGVIAGLWYVERSARPVRDLSKMMSVKLVVSEALAAHHRRQGSYPNSLGELPLQTLHWGDEGSTVRDMEAWSYVSDGLSFTMTWTNARGAELFLGGRTGQVYYSRDETR